MPYCQTLGQVLLWACLGSMTMPLAQAMEPIVINEIMYHPASENALEEFVEIHNVGATNVNLTGWRIEGGLDFYFPSNQVIAPGGFLVIAADVPTFSAKYPAVPTPVGPWRGILSNSRNRIELINALDQEVDRVTYADEGEWAVRQRGPLQGSHRGWVWSKLHDGLGRSLELTQPGLPNEYGQNWLASLTEEGTPGVANSVRTDNIPPLIVQPAHFPLIPTSADNVAFSCRVVDESGAGGVTVRLHWRIDGTNPPPFASVLLRDDGQSADGLAGDGLFGIEVGPFPDDTIVEFYFSAEDGAGMIRTWPAAAQQTDGSFAQTANALLQVEDDPYTGEAPLYKLILTTEEFIEIGNLFASNPGSDAQMNATFVAREADRVEVRHLTGIRNRGHGSRYRRPHNYRINFRTDEKWLGAGAVNMNAFNSHIQHLGATVALKAGALGGYSRAVQLRVNNGPSPGGTPTFGHFAANEVVDSDWAENHLPDNDGGNIYKVVRDLKPPDFNYRGEDPNAYRNTYFKRTNVSEDDWTDLIGMLNVMGISNNVAFTTENVRSVVDVEQWLLHLAVMSIFSNAESGLNTGNNDDYLLYSGDVDPRFLLVYHDLDSILGNNSFGTTQNIFLAATYPVSNDSGGTGQAMERFMLWPEFEPIYYTILHRLLNTVFSPAEFNPLVDQTLGAYVPASGAGAASRENIKSWMASRRSHILSIINNQVPPDAGFATISGEPKSPSPVSSASLQVGGAGLVAYRYRLNDGDFSSERSIDQPITLTGLPDGSTNVVSVLGRHSNGAWQDGRFPTVSQSWVVDLSAPPISLSEVLARNDGVYDHQGTFPDAIELVNHGPVAFDVAGMRLTDDADQTNKFVFPTGSAQTVIPSGGYLVVLANDDDGTGGWHTGFGLNQTGEELYLYDAGGRLLDHVIFGQQLPNLSVGRIGATGEWSLNVPTLGADNVAQPVGDAHDLRINEWLATASPPFYEDFVELLNPTSLPVDAGELYLTDNAIGLPLRSAIATASFIPAGGYLVLLADGREGRPGHVGFQLADERGEIALVDSWRQVIDCFVYGLQGHGASMGRCPDGADWYQRQTQPTPGAANSCSIGPPPLGDGLVLNEILASNSAAFLEGDGSSPDLVELFNASDATVSLGNMQLANGLAEPRSIWTFPAGTTLPSLGFMKLHCDPNRPVSSTNTGFSLNANGGSLYLLDTPLQGGAVLDVVHFGLQVTDFSIARVPDGGTNWQLALPTLGSANLAAFLAEAATVRINEWLAEPDSGPDWFELFNPNDQPVAIGGFYLTDDLGNFAKSRIPNLSFLGGGSNAWQRFVADGDLDQGAHHVDFSLKLDGEALGLFDAQGGQIDAQALANQTPGVAEGRLPDGQGAVTQFPASATPGARNYLPLTDVVVNEVLTHTDLPLEDAIELHNLSGAMVDISGWWLSDQALSLFKYQIPPGTVIPPNGFAVFYENRFNDGDFAAIPFSLNSAHGDEVHLTAAPGGVPNGRRHVVTFGPAANGVSFGRHPTSLGTDFSALTARTFGVDTPNTVTEFRQGNGLANAAPIIGPLVFTEIMYHPPDLNTADNVRDEFLEIRNLSGGSVSLFDPSFPSHTWRLRKGVDFEFPSGVTIGPGSSLLVVGFDPGNDALSRAGFTAVYGTNFVLFGPYRGKLDNGGETIELQRPDFPQTTPGPDFGFVPYITVDRISFRDEAPWPLGGDGDGLSLQRLVPGNYGNDPVNWVPGAPSPAPGSVEFIDADLDGMPNDWEIANGLDPGRADGSEDADLDGMTNLEEYLAGTDPQDPTSNLRVTFDGFAGGQPIIRFTIHPEKTYSLLYRDSLSAGAWQSLTNFPAQAGPVEMTVQDSTIIGTQQRFYQLVSPAWP